MASSVTQLGIPATLSSALTDAQDQIADLTAQLAAMATVASSGLLSDVDVTGLPTSDPHVAGLWWRNTNVPTISAG